MTDVAGLVTLFAAPGPATVAAPRPFMPHPPSRNYQPPATAIVEVAVDGARLVQPLSRAYGWQPGDADLVSYRLGGAPGAGVRPHGILYVDRDYYRPGEWVHFAALAREGLLGALRPPPPGDSAHLTVVRNGPTFGGGQDVVRDTVLRLDAFGTVVDSLRIAPAAPLDAYVASIALWRDGQWEHVARTEYHVAEYRAPEFLVGAALDSTTHILGDTVRATVDARLLFDAPMPGATLRWQSSVTPTASVALPGLPATWSVGGRDWSSFGGYDRMGGERAEQHQGTVTLDGHGPARIAIPTTRGLFTRPATLRLDAAVTDLNRQTVTQSTAVTVHAARLYLATHDSADAWSWRAGVPRAVRVLALRPDGHVARGVHVRVAVVAAKWVRDTTGQGPGRWVTDTLSRDSTVTPTTRNAPALADTALADTALAATVRVVPSRAGATAIVLRATDEDGHPATTVLTGWTLGTEGDVASWQQYSPVRLPLYATRLHLAPGDSAEVQFTSPFADATAWITIERERVLRSWSTPAPRGPHTIRVPVTAADAPNVYVGVTLVPRGPDALGASADRAAATPLDRRLRAGYVLIDVTSNAQQLKLSIAPRERTYAPGDTARLAVRVTDATGHGTPAAVTLWAVDAGVLALGDYQRPDPVATLYTREGLGWTLGSTFTHLGTAAPIWMRWPQAQSLGSAVAGGRIQLRGTSVQSDRRVRRTGESQESSDFAVVDRPLPAPPPGGGRGPTVRADFRSTAFFLGGIRTGADGRAEASAKLPDNLTTFRIVAVAASAGDAYAGADTSLVATRPLTVRAALPRFVRTGDSLLAGAVVTWRDTTLRDRATAHLAVRVDADASGGLARQSTARQVSTLAPGASAELRWPWRVATDSGIARVHFAATAAPHGADAVVVALPVRPAFVPRVYALTGTLPGGPSASDTVRIALPAGLDAGRSRLALMAGPTPTPVVRTIAAQLAAYPYDCTEQLTSLGRALVALLRVHSTTADTVADAPARLQAVVDALARRQRADGAFGYWGNESWSTAWLSGEVGRLLLDAKRAGAIVDPSVTRHLAAYLADTARRPLPRRDSLFGTPTERRDQAARTLAGRLAALAYLRRADAPDTAAERALIARAAELAWEDRASLALLLAARGDSSHAGALVDTLWRAVGRAGARAELGDSLLRTAVDFPSRVRPPARLLLATRALRPAHPRLGELAAMLQQRAALDRGRGWWAWNTQDLAAAAEGFAALADAAPNGAPAPEVHVATAGGPPLTVGGAPAPLAGLLSRAGDHDVLTVHVARGASAGPTFYALTVDAVPAAAGTRQRGAREDAGITVERWVEPLDAFAPATVGDTRPPRALGDLAAGALVRVRLRVTVPADREFVALEDPLPAGLEAVDLSLRTSGTLAPFIGRHSAAAPAVNAEDTSDDASVGPARWRPWGRWGSPWEHTEQRDDAVRWFARRLGRGTYTVSYVARATTAGRFARVPAHAEEMYNPALTGRTDGGALVVRDGATPRPGP